MDRKEIAKKIREAIFNRIEEDRAIHASSIEQEVEKVLGVMSLGHYPGRGASAPVPETHTLTQSDIPSHSSFLKVYKAPPEMAGSFVYWSSPHEFISWTPDPSSGNAVLTVSEPPACTHIISSTGGVMKKPDGFRDPFGLILCGRVDECDGSIGYEWKSEAQVKIIHPEAADK